MRSNLREFNETFFHVGHVDFSATKRENKGGLNDQKNEIVGSNREDCGSWNRGTR